MKNIVTLIILGFLSMALRAQGVPTISFNFANVGSGETAMCPNTIANLNQTIIHLVDCPDVECGTFVEMLFLDEGKNILDRYLIAGQRRVDDLSLFLHDQQRHRRYDTVR